MPAGDSVTRDFGTKLVHALQAALAVRSYGPQPSDVLPLYGLTDALSDELRRTLGELQQCELYQEPEKARGGVRIHINVIREAGEQIYGAATGEFRMIPPATLRRFIRAGIAVVEKITGRRYGPQDAVERMSGRVDLKEIAHTDTAKKKEPRTRPKGRVRGGEPGQKTKTRDGFTLSTLPALGKSSGEWVLQDEAAKLERVKVRTLANDRSAGEKARDGCAGIDRRGRGWQKETRKSQKVYYLKSSLSDN